MSRTFAAALVVCAVALGRSACAEQPIETRAEAPIGHIPDGYQIERTLPSHWIVPAGFSFAASYFLAFSVDAASDFRGPESALIVPFSGPFVTIAGRQRQRCFQTVFWGCWPDLDAREARIETALAVDGIAQIVSFTMFVVGLQAPRYKLVRREWALGVAPIRVAGGYGIGFHGAL